MDYKFYLCRREFIGNKIVLYKRKTASGKPGKIWQCEVRIHENRRSITKSTKSSEFAVARDFAHKLFYEVEGLKKIGEISRLWKKDFEDLVHEFRTHVREGIRLTIYKPSRMKAAQDRMQPWLRYIDKPVAQITQEIIDGYAHSRQTNAKRPIAKTTMKMEYNAMSVCLKFAVKKKYLTANAMPTSVFKLNGKEDVNRQAGFTKDDLETLLNYLRRDLIPSSTRRNVEFRRRQFLNYVLLMSYSGLRDGEMRSLQWKHWSIEEEDSVKWPRISVINGKTGDRELYPLDRSVIVINSQLQLRDDFLDGKYLGADDYIFISPAGKRLRTIRDSFEKHCRDAGVLYDIAGKKRVPTSLRH